MSNYLVAKGLGGLLVVTGGLGPEPTADDLGQILKLSTGNLRISIRRISTKVFLYFNDDVNVLVTELPVTPEQLAAEAWMNVTINRVGSNLNIMLEDADPIVIPLGTIKEYGGTATVMKNQSGKVFDLRFLPREISQTKKTYYLADLDENEGKALLPWNT